MRTLVWHTFSLPVDLVADSASLAQELPTGASLFLDKSLADGVGYLIFYFLMVVAVGYGYLALLSEVMHKRTQMTEYLSASRLSVKLSQVFLLLTLVFFLGLAISASILSPTTLSLPFGVDVFGWPLAVFALLLVAELVAITVWSHVRTDGKLRLCLGSVAGILGTAALLTFNLVHTYMLAPALPEGLLAVLRSDLGWEQFSLMVNLGWLPITLKMALVGTLTAALILSMMAVLNSRKTTRNEAKRRWIFLASWSFKGGLLFGASIGIVGYWVSAILHASTPTIALGLMGETGAGLSAALVSTLSPLWHIGIIGALALAASAIAFYLDLGRRTGPPEGTRRLVTRHLTLFSSVFLAVGVVSASDASIFYPKQGILAIYVLVGGYLILETLRLYSEGRVRLHVPVLIFALACFFLLIYVGPYTKWYLSERYGGVPWPLVAFIVAVPAAFALTTRIRLGRYILPVVCGLVAPAVLFLKLMDTTLLKGPTLVAIDPTAKSFVDSWAYANYVSLDPVLQEYPSLVPEQAILAVIVAYAVFLLLALCAYRFTRGTLRKEFTAVDSRSGAVANQ